MGEYQYYRIDPKQFLIIATNVLHKTLLEASRATAKSVFKAIREGRRVSLLDVKMEEDADVRFDLALDHSEFRGGKLNFTAFRDSVTALVATLGENLRQAKDIPAFTEQGGGAMLFGVPAATRNGGEINVLMLGAELRGPDGVLRNLTYLDPSQFENMENPRG